MTPAETRLAVGLALAAPGSLLAAAALRLLLRWGVLASTLATLAGLGCGTAGVLLAYLRWPGPLPADVALLTWSPLGLYGVTFALRLQPEALLPALPVLALTALGAAERRAARRSTRAADAFALLAVSGAMLACVAGDLVSLFLAVGVNLAAGTLTLWCVAGARPAGHRTMAVYAAGVGLLVSVLVLGKVNGLFRLAQLSTAGFTSAPFAGVLLAGAVVAPVPPFHGWLLRVARQPLAPALGAAGGAAALVLLLTTFQVTAGQFPPSWQRWLGALAWTCALATTGIALARSAAPVRFAALFVGQATTTLLATSVATPASMAAAVLYFFFTAPFVALLWLVVRANSAGTASRSAGRQVPAAHPGFWLFALLLAGAAGLPGTAGGLAHTALLSALTSWPSGDQLHRLPPALLSACTLVVGGSLLWRRPWFAGVRGPAGWAIVAAAGALLAAPAAFPAQLVDSWFGAAAARIAGTTNPPLTVAASRVPNVFSALLGLLALWALAQSLRGREWLPGAARAAVGVATLGWGQLRRAWRRHEMSNAPSRASDATLRRVEAAAGQMAHLLRPLEERYYAAGAVMLAVALIYIIGR